MRAATFEWFDPRLRGVLTHGRPPEHIERKAYVEAEIDRARANGAVDLTAEFKRIRDHVARVQRYAEADEDAEIKRTAQRERAFTGIFDSFNPEQKRRYMALSPEEKAAIWFRETSRYTDPNHERYGPGHDNWTRLAGKGRSEDQEELGDDSAEDSDD